LIGQPPSGRTRNIRTADGLTEDASWGKMSPTWGSASDVAELDRLFDMMGDFCTRNDLPAFVGEFNASDRERIRLACSLDVGGGQRGTLEEDGSGALGHRARGLPASALRRQPRAASAVAAPPTLRGMKLAPVEVTLR
jgi:hypothetical protein